MQPFWARTSTSIWKNWKEKQPLTISNLQCALWGSGPLVENVHESANGRFWKTFKKKWLYTYIHACSVCVHSLYKKVCLFPGLTHQLTQSWVWQQTSAAVLYSDERFLPCLVHWAAFPAFCLHDCERMDMGKGLCIAAGVGGSFQVHFDVLYSYQCSDWWINIPKDVSVPIHIEFFDGSVWLQSWSWIANGLGSGPHNLHLMQYGRKLLWNLRKIWEVSFLSNDKTQILSSLAEHCGIYWQWSSSASILRFSE